MEKFLQKLITIINTIYIAIEIFAISNICKYSLKNSVTNKFQSTVFYE